MKPAFALSLSYEGISLLHRCAGGWRNAGEAALDAPDLATALSGLRGAASRLEPGPLRSKLIIPNEQIRYLSIETGTADRQTCDQMVRAALEGATFYAVDELAYDISIEGHTTHIAAVAHETLEEAENFALEHQFGPVSFVAIPGKKPFLGEPYFGPTRHAATVLAPGETVEPDGIAVVVVGPAQFPVEGAVPTPEPEVTAEPQAAPVDDPAPEPADPPVEAAPTESAVPTFSSRRRRGTETYAPAKAEPPLEAQQLPVATDPVEDPLPEPPVATPAAPQPAAALELPKAEPPAPVSAPPLAAQAAAPAVAPPRKIDLGKNPNKGDDAPKAGLLSGLLRRRGRDTPPVEAPLASAAPAAPTAPRRELDVSGMPPKLAAAVLKTAERSTTPAGEGPLDPPAEAQRMTVFGAHQPADANAKSRPHFLGLILTAVLLLFLAGVAAWASIFIDDDLAGLFSREPQDATVANDAPAPASDTPSVAAFTVPQLDAPDPGSAQALDAPIGAEEPITLAALDPTTAGLTDTDAAVLDALRSPRSQPGITSAQDPETRYAVTGIWSEAPPEPITPSVIGLDDLFVGSIDNRELSQDAVALPDMAILLTDDPIGARTSPTAPGVTFDFDERGLVRATPEGTVTPEGIIVYLGRPDIVPPATPNRTVQAPEENTLRDRLAGFRPRGRPDNLSEQAERGQLGGLTLDELAGIRPKARPENVKTVEETADEDATAQAVADSVRPKNRPSNFAAKVDKQKADPANTQVAAIAPAAITPKIPSSASVSRQATLNNAIDLRKVNLIGVYGTPSNRRALVRLPSGRYKKVQVGDTIDGGRVSAIGDSELRYQKGGRNLVLKIPSG
ncbi:MAG: hypothetical protein JJ897_00335 [Marinibacterium sp.]|nr:hypothetical protein [Marinibacterium sp.]